MPTVHQLVKELKKCGLVIQWGIFSIEKRNELLLLATTWISLKNIMLNEKARNKRLHIILFCLYEISRKGKTIERGSTSVVALGPQVGARTD